MKTATIKDIMLYMLVVSIISAVIGSLLKMNGHKSLGDIFLAICVVDTFLLVATFFTYFFLPNRYKTQEKKER